MVKIVESKSLSDFDPKEVAYVRKARSEMSKRDDDNEKFNIYDRYYFNAGKAGFSHDNFVQIYDILEDGE